MTDWLIGVARETWYLGLEMAPYIVVGLMAAIVVFAAFPKDKIQRVLGKPGWGSTIKAALAGIPLPLCSCGVLPTALSLKKQGASKGATVSFLVSTPETGLDSIAVTYALINPLMTILRPLAAAISAITTGLAVDRFGTPDDEARINARAACAVCGDADCPTPHSWWARLRSSARYVVNDFFPEIANWIVLGLVLSGVMAAFLPKDLFTGASGAAQMAIAIVAGVPMYICASASTPIAAVLLAKGMAPGAALVFLLVGPATNIMSLTVIGRELGRRTAVVYLTSVILTSLIIGILVNTFFGDFNWAPRIADPELHEHLSYFNIAGVVILVLAILNTWRLKRAARLQKRRVTAASPAGM
ncbi:MAG TPA: SO_0444 family Cu/Zn efflux transporter [Acidobacteriota bacterium]|nr:SO_0444 family Cu/Zn efflux transporter [Acidobacteriota bacterium]